jgi:non-specific serine/threonine protein kinase
LAEENWERARQVVAELGDRRAEAALLGNLGAVASSRGEPRRALELQQEAADAAESVNDGATVALARINQAENLRALGELERAAALVEEGAALLREYGLRGYAAQALHMHAAIALSQGNHRQAVSLQHASLAGFTEIGDQRSITDSAVLLAEICIALNKAAPAVELLSGASAMRDGLGIQMNPVQAQELNTLTTRLKRMVRDADYSRAWRTGLRLEPGDLVRRMVEVGSDLTGEPAVMEPVPAPSDPIETLSAREREVMGLMVQGRSSREIGDALYISPRTATTHINNIYVKLHVNTRAQAVALAVRAGVGD